MYKAINPRTGILEDIEISQENINYINNVIAGDCRVSTDCGGVILCSVEYKESKESDVEIIDPDKIIKHKLYVSSYQYRSHFGKIGRNVALHDPKYGGDKEACKLSERNRK